MPYMEHSSTLPDSKNSKRKRFGCVNKCLHALPLRKRISDYQPKITKCNHHIDIKSFDVNKLRSSLIFLCHKYSPI